MIEFADESRKRGMRSGLCGLAAQSGLSIERVLRLAEHGELGRVIQPANTPEGQERRRIEARRRERQEERTAPPGAPSGRMSGRVALARAMGMRWPE